MLFCSGANSKRACAIFVPRCTCCSSRLLRWPTRITQATTAMAVLDTKMPSFRPGKIFINKCRVSCINLTDELLIDWGYFIYWFGFMYVTLCLINVLCFNFISQYSNFWQSCSYINFDKLNVFSSGYFPCIFIGV